MKHLKILGLLAATGAAWMAFTSSASATTVTSSTGMTPEIHAKTIGELSWHNAVGTIACNSTFAFKIEKHGEKDSKGNTLPVAGKITTLSFTQCTNGSVHSVPGTEGHVTTPGSLAIHAGSKTGNGTLTWSGATLVTTIVGVECGYSTNNTDLGEIVGGTHAVLKISVTLVRHSGSFFCGSTANWTGEYKFTHPTNLEFH